VNPAEALASTVRAYTPGVIPGRPRWVSPVMPWAACDQGRKRDLAAAWEMGELRHHLTPSQGKAHAKLTAWDRGNSRMGREYALDSSRRWGKSVLACVMALEKAIQNKSWRIVYCAPEYKMVNKILLPLMSMLTIDCPPGLHGPKCGPEWVKSEGTFYFRNGSRIELVGLDVNPDGARGTGLDWCVLDEAAFFDNFEYLLQSVISPQMLGRKHARVLGASTPPISPSHYWSQTYVPEAVERGAHDIRTLEEADQYDWDEIEEFIQKAGGRKSVTCRREYFCEHVTDETMAIVPEFREVEHEIVKAPEKIPYWRDCYVSMDPGWKDLTAVLFGHWDFERQVLVVEDELAAPRLNSAEVATGIKAKELALWSKAQCKGMNGQLRAQPYLRVSDNEPRLLWDLSTAHGLSFVATQKDNFDQQVNALRIAIQQKQIQIHPRCKRLVLHLKNGVWRNELKKQFAWEGGDLGHFDLIAALIYLWRNVNKKRNPAPAAERRINDQDKHQHRATADTTTRSKWSRHGRRFFVR
jgi:hypothetical protein